MIHILQPHAPWLGFDIETKPRPDLVDRFCRPFPAFDEKAVKYGNTKDPEKRAVILSEKRAEHEQSQEDYWKGLRERAALDPITGEILVIGIIDPAGGECYLEGKEADVIREFWVIFRSHFYPVTKFVYWSGSGDPSQNFDIDYIVMRSRILGIPVPPLVRKGRFYADRLVDLAKEFLLHRRGEYIKLSRAADILGLYELHPDLRRKADDDLVTGANFHEWYEGKMLAVDAETEKPCQRPLAMRYLRNDLLHLRYAAPRIL